MNVISFVKLYAVLNFCTLNFIYFCTLSLFPQSCRVKSISRFSIKDPNKAERRSEATRGVAYLAWRSVFAVEGISGTTADEGMQLMGSDIDESPGYEVVNRDWPLAPPGRFASAAFAPGGLSG